MNTYIQEPKEKDRFEVIVEALDRTYIQGLTHCIKILEAQIRTEDTRMCVTRDDLAINLFIAQTIEKIKKLIVK